METDLNLKMQALYEHIQRQSLLVSNQLESHSTTSLLGHKCAHPIKHSSCSMKVSNDRGLLISDSNSSSTLVLPRFVRDNVPTLDAYGNVDEWIDECEIFFEKYGVSELNKVFLASHYMKDEAKMWYESIKKEQELNWSLFKEAFYVRFRSAQRESIQSTCPSLTISSQECNLVTHNELVEAYQSDATSECEKVTKFVSKKCDLDKQYNCGVEAVDRRPLSLITTAVPIVSEVAIKDISSELEMRSDEEHMNLQKFDSLGFHQEVINGSCRDEQCKFYDEFVAEPVSLQFQNEFAKCSYASFHDFSPLVLQYFTFEFMHPFYRPSWDSGGLCEEANLIVWKCSNPWTKNTTLLDTPINMFASELKDRDGEIMKPIVTHVDLEKLEALRIYFTTKDYERIDEVIANVMTVTTWVSNLPIFGREKLKCVQITMGMGNITVGVRHHSYLPQVLNRRLQPLWAFELNKCRHLAIIREYEFIENGAKHKWHFTEERIGSIFLHLSCRFQERIIWDPGIQSFLLEEHCIIGWLMSVVQ